MLLRAKKLETQLSSILDPTSPVAARLQHAYYNFERAVRGHCEERPHPLTSFNNFTSTEPLPDIILATFIEGVMFALLYTPNHKIADVVLVLVKSGFLSNDLHKLGKPKTIADELFWELVNRLPGGRYFYVARQYFLCSWDSNLEMRKKIKSSHIYELSADHVTSKYPEWWAPRNLDKLIMQTNAFGAIFNPAENWKFYFENEEDEMMMRIRYP